MPHHISDMLEDLYAALDAGRAWSLVRLGDGEAHALRGVHAPWSYVGENYVATHTDAGDLRQFSLEAIARADWVGWPKDTPLGQTLEAASLLPPGWTEWHLAQCTFLSRQPTDEEHIERFGELPWLIQRQQYAWANMQMGIRRGFVERVLRNTQLFLVGEPMRYWRDHVLHPAGLGQDALVWEGQATISTMAEAHAIVDAFAASPARVMLASMGVWAVPMVGRAKVVGKVGIDWGHLPDHNAKPTCEVHRDAFDPPYPAGGVCPNDPACQAHWRYKLNTTEEDSPAGTMAWYPKAGAPLSLPEKGY